MNEFCILYHRGDNHWRKVECQTLRQAREVAEATRSMNWLVIAIRRWNGNEWVDVQ
jgi:hypothetical protein